MAGNMTAVVQMFICGFLLLFSGLEFIEACQSGKLNDLSIRSPNHSFDSEGLFLSDDGLQEGWFTTRESGWLYIMADENEMPNIGACSTYWPIYLEGTHPDVEELGFAPVTATACLRIDGFPCGYSADIQIRKCGPDLQYYLPHTLPYSAYCFSKYENMCVEQAAAPTDAEFGEVTVSPELYHKDVTIETKTNHEPYFLMRCNFKTKQDLKYIVEWYIDGKFRTSYGPVDEDAIDELTLDETEIDRLGIEIVCAVMASARECGKQTDRTYSASFYAGIKILTPSITMAKGKRGTIEMKTTVPIGCKYDDDDTSTCTAQVRIFDATTPGYNCTDGGIANIKTKAENHQCSTGIEV